MMSFICIGVFFAFDVTPVSLALVPTVCAGLASEFNSELGACVCRLLFASVFANDFEVTPGTRTLVPTVCAGIVS